MRKIINVINRYCATTFPDDPVELSKEVLAHPEDKRVLELYPFYLAINADFIDGKAIEANLPKNLRPLFIEEYNMAFLFLKVWSYLVKHRAGREIILPNLYLDLESKADNPYYLYNLYRTRLGKIQRWAERRWNEIIRCQLN